MKKIFALLLIGLFCFNQCYAATGWLKTKPADGDNPGTIDDSVGENNAAIDLMLSKYRANCRLSYDTVAQLTVGTGEVMVSNAAGTVRLMLANTSSITATWAMIDTGAEAPSTTYYVYAIASDVTDTEFTVKLSTSSTAPTGVTYYRRLGSFYNDASSNITLIANDDQTVRYYDSGWFAATTSTSYTKTHSLGTTKVLPVLFISNNSDGSGYCVQSSGADMNGSNVYQSSIVALTNTTVIVRTGPTALFHGIDSTGTEINITSGYARVLLMALE